MKDYQGPAYQKRDVNYDNRRFNRESQSPSAKGAPYKFKSALEEKQETSRGHRPVYHHEQPWRDQPQKMIDQASEPVPALPEEPDYRVPYRERRSQGEGYNAERVRERMTPADPVQDQAPPPQYEPGESLRLPQTRANRSERAHVAPAERRPAEDDWPVPGASQRSSGRDRQVLDDFLQAPVRETARRPWQEPSRRESEASGHEVSSQRQVSEAQAKFQSLLENGRDSQTVAQQAKAERFKPKELPKPYQPPRPQTVTEVGVSREILQRMVKPKDSYLLFEEESL